MKGGREGGNRVCVIFFVVDCALSWISIFLQDHNTMTNVMVRRVEKILV